uniref:Cilia- and flagella-associated protein 157 n=1 Tax=Gongylonema pulchrum TaxID=637853 RepID=A0A183D5T1_9BILA
LEEEVKSKLDFLHQKKRHESEINELEVTLDQANRMNVDVQKNIKRYIEQIKNLQGQLDEEQRSRDELHANTIALEKRLALVRSENDDAMATFTKVICRNSFSVTAKAFFTC